MFDTDFSVVAPDYDPDVDYNEQLENHLADLGLDVFDAWQFVHTGGTVTRLAA